ISYPNQNPINFDVFADGLNRIYAVSFSGPLNTPLGVPIDAITFSDSCYDVSDNFVTVIVDEPRAGTISNNFGLDTINMCSGDGIDDIVEVSITGASSAQFSWVVTDEDNVILEFPDTSIVNFENAPSGICKIYSIAWTSDLLLEVGDTLMTNPISDDCSDISTNFVTVVREFTDGGMISTVDGELEVYTCPGDSISDLILFNSTTTARESYVFLITNQANELLALSSAANFNFENAGTGICKVYGVSFTGNLTVVLNNSIFDTPISNGCFDISENFITVIRDVPDIGFLNYPGSNSDTSKLCLANGVGSVRITVDGLSNAPNRFIITDTANVVVGFSDTTVIDFSGAGNGICNVWGAAYTGNFTIQIGDDLDSTAVSDDCYKISENHLQFIRTDLPVGTITTDVGEDIFYTCPGDGIDDNINVIANTNFPDSEYVFIVTDTLFEILAIEEGPTIRFDGAPEGVCWVWGLAYQDSLLAMPGQNASRSNLAEGCFALTPNFITVIREIPEGGDIQLSDSTTLAYVCNQDLNPDILTFEKLNASSGNYQYIITDKSNIIQSIPNSDRIDFNNMETGSCLVWGVAYTGNFIANVGDRVGVDPLSDDCVDVSNNFVEVIRDRPNGGSVFTVDDMKSIDICVGDGNPDFIEFKAIAESNTPYTFVVTDVNNMVLEVLENSFQNFEGAGEGVCRVYGVAYTGSLADLPGNNITNIDLSDDCYNLSIDYITINRFTSGPTCNTSTVDLEGIQYFKVFPNPSNGIVKISNESNLQIDNIEFINQLGQTQLLNSNQTSFDLSHCKNGVYYLRIHSEKGVQTSKLLITNY
ncbi:MAG: T9SS type A sorting domain-containing protein, partial [Bacteroidota bacterium]